MKKMLITLLSLLLCLTITGCGQSTNTSEKKTLRVGMECNYAPFNWTDADSNEYNVAISAGGYCDGYDVAIAKNIAENLDMELEIIKMDWDSLIQGVNNDIIDLIIAGMTATPTRKEAIDFTEPYYESSMTIIVRSDSQYANATSLEDFSGAKIAGQLSTLYDTVIDQIPNVNHATAMESYPLLVQALLSGVIDGVTAEAPVGLGNVAANEGKLTLISFDEGKGFDVDLTDTSVSIGMKKNSELYQAVSDALAAISTQDRQAMMQEATNRQPAVE